MTEQQQPPIAKGILYLIPVPVSGGTAATIPADVITIMHGLRHFIVENARSARRYIKTTEPPFAIDTLEIVELRREQSFDLEALFQPIREGHSVGLMSEAGCPAVADPGAHVVEYAHKHGIRVRPLVGPSSIILALMASGLNGQSFTFHGYVTAKRERLNGALRRLEKLSRDARATQVFIEAPHRNRQIFAASLEALRPNTQMCIATHLTAPDEFVKTATIREWSQLGPPDFHKKPTIFLLYAR